MTNADMSLRGLARAGKGSLYGDLRVPVEQAVGRCVLLVGVGSRLEVASVVRNILEEAKPGLDNNHEPIVQATKTGHLHTVQYDIGSNSLRLAIFDMRLLPASWIHTTSILLHLILVPVPCAVGSAI
jgi:hypothetical protein